MYRRAFLAGLSACLASRPLAAQPRTDGKQLRIGVLTMRRPEDSSPQQAALIAGLREHGYIDGRNVVIDLPDVRGHEDLLPDAVAGLVRRRADVILIVGPAPLEAARKATKSIPLVMVASSADPVADGVAASLARPGGNITGLAYAEPDRFKKQIELLQVAAPASVASRCSGTSTSKNFAEAGLPRWRMRGAYSAYTCSIRCESRTQPTCLPRSPR